MNIWIVHHSSKYGDTLEAYATERLAKDRFKEILQDYAEDGYELDIDAANDSELNEATDGRSSLNIEDTIVKGTL